MGKLEERKDGYFFLENVKIGVVTIPTKVFKEIKNIPLEQISTEPKDNGFYLDIPDR